MRMWLLGHICSGAHGNVSPGRTAAGVAARGTVTGVTAAAALVGAIVETGTAEAAAAPAAVAGGVLTAAGMLGATGVAGTAEAAAAAPAAVGGARAAGEALTTGTMVPVDAEEPSWGWMEGEA